MCVVSVRRALLPPAVVVILLSGAVGPVPAGATGLLAVRHWSAPDHTRIVIDLSGPAAYRHRTLEEPARIAVDVDGGWFRFPLRRIPIEDGIVKQLRFNMLRQSGKAQIVVDLERSCRYDVFALDKLDSKPHRIVIDVKRSPPAAPRPARPREERALGPEHFGAFLIMVDPGHGGEDPGRSNPGGMVEKDIALELSRALVKELDSRRGYRGELTRAGDYFVSLRRRREITEEQGAHLFVSLHFNAASARSARGTEVFFVSLAGAGDRATRELVQAENSSDLVGGLPPRDEETEGELTRMLVDLRQNDSVERSQRLATLLTDHVGRLRGVRARKVKQAGFAVLKSLFIPAALVEVGFLTNRGDVRFIRSRRNRERYAKALADGIVAYCEEVEIPRLGWKIHTVHRGETLSAIALTYAMDLDALRGANDLNGDRIYVGQKLRVRPR